MSDLYAWLTTLPNGQENLVAIGVGDAQLPCVFADLRVAKMAKAAATLHRFTTGQPVKLVQFSEVKVLDSEGYDAP